MQEFKTIVVCGAGTMGAGIAQVAAQAGFSTILFDLQNEVLAKAQLHIGKNLEKLVNKGLVPVDQLPLISGRLHYSSHITDCTGDLIIEAIVEKLDVKQAVFQQLANMNGANSVYTSNTSSISINLLAQSFPFPAQFAGLHFFNPAPIMKLVEVIRGEKTSDRVVDSLVQLTRAMGKTPVLCNDAPGFIVNRVARHYYLEAMYMVENGLINLEEADTILENAGFKMGPFTLMDLIGMDINYGVSNIVWEALGKPSRLQPSRLQKEKVEAGALGKKTGKGFYDYPL